MRAGAKEGGKVNEKKRKWGNKKWKEKQSQDTLETGAREKNSPFDLSAGEGGGR